MQCSVCPNQDDMPIGYIVLHEIYSEFLGKDGEIQPMAVFCSLRCANFWIAQAQRLDQKATHKTKGRK